MKKERMKKYIIDQEYSCLFWLNDQSLHSCFDWLRISSIINKYKYKYEYIFTIIIR